MNVIPYAGSVRRIVVGTENLYARNNAQGRLQYHRDEVGFRLVILTNVRRRVCTGCVKITKGSVIITSVEVHDGAYVDGTNFKKHLENTLETGIKIEAGYGDKAYFRKSIIEALEGINAEVIIPPSESVYRIDESKYSYNKDSDQWICEEGNYSVEKKKVNREDKNAYEYYFSKEDCINCPKCQECCGKAKRKRFIVGEASPLYY